jgi:hypothetical protein
MVYTYKELDIDEIQSWSEEKRNEMMGHLHRLCKRLSDEYTNAIFYRAFRNEPESIGNIIMKKFTYLGILLNDATIEGFMLYDNYPRLPHKVQRYFICATKGSGRRLNELFEDELIIRTKVYQMAGLFKTNEPTTILLDSVNHPEVIAFHKKMGYVEAGDLNEQNDTVPMKKILPPVSTPAAAALVGSASGGKRRRYATRKH